MSSHNQKDADIIGMVIGLKRMRRGLSLDVLAEKSGIPWDSIRDVEKGRELPSKEWLEQVALGFGSTADKLLAEADYINERVELVTVLRRIMRSEDEAAWRELLEFLQRFGQDDTL